MVGILFQSRIQEKDHRHFQSFAGSELLFVETETGDLIEISPGAIGADVEHGPRHRHRCSDIFVTL